MTGGYANWNKQEIIWDVIEKTGGKWEIKKSPGIPPITAPFVNVTSEMDPVQMKHRITGVVGMLNLQLYEQVKVMLAQIDGGEMIQEVLDEAIEWNGQWVEVSDAELAKDKDVALEKAKEQLVVKLSIGSRTYFRR